MAGYRFDDGSYISIEYDDVPGDQGRTRYHYVIDDGNGHEYERSDLQSGVGHHGIQYGLTALVDYLLSAAEYVDDPEGHSFDEHWVAEWAAFHQANLEMLSLDLEEYDLIKE
jgi:hypothetical protein